MHIYFSGIGGTGIGPLALIAHQAGYTVSGSDKQTSQYTHYLEKHGIALHIGQTEDQINAVHEQQPIDWLVYSSALPLENPQHPELVFAQDHGIHTSKRDECLNKILADKGLHMIAAAGTHGKTTTTAMLIWLFLQQHVPLSYSVGAKISFGDMGLYDPSSTFFAYECDEFDKNFLQFNPEISIISSVDWDHHEIYPTREAYIEAFRQFINQSSYTYLYKHDAEYLGVVDQSNVAVIDDNDTLLDSITLAGTHNRRNARLVVAAVARALHMDETMLVQVISSFPGVSRRFEQIVPRLYSDYAHTPEEIAATLQLAGELSDNVVVVYEPLTDRRQHYMKDAYRTIFEQAEAVYWLPSYLAREDSTQQILTPDELVANLSEATHASVAQKDDKLKEVISSALEAGKTVLCLAGGGGGSLDEWVRQNFVKPAQ
ncbi:MAG: Mur ligase domain-containing protein [Candidatus Saccharimonadales bacterium]